MSNKSDRNSVISHYSFPDRYRESSELLALTDYAYETFFFENPDILSEVPQVDEVRERSLIRFDEENLKEHLQENYSNGDLEKYLSTIFPELNIDILSQKALRNQFLVSPVRDLQNRGIIFSYRARSTNKKNSHYLAIGKSLRDISFDKMYDNL